jgi:hypothetical protein
MTPARVELHIEELVLYGLAPGDRHRIGQAVRRELTRLFAERGVPPRLARGGEVARLDGGSFHLEPGLRAEATGTRVARAVYGGLSR